MCECDHNEVRVKKVENHKYKNIEERGRGWRKLRRSNREKREILFNQSMKKIDITISLCRYFMRKEL